MLDIFVSQGLSCFRIFSPSLAAKVDETRWLAMPISKSIVAIVGTTAAGKSRLAVDIARTYKGEVINADAMQVFRGLDTITNKISHDEMHGVPHHLLGCKAPGEEYVVGHWVSDAVQLVSYS